MTETKQTSTTKTDRRPDCVTENRMGNSVLTVSGFFKQGATDTAADKMMKVLEAEAAAGHTPPFSAKVMTWKSGHAGEHDRWNISNNFIFSEVSTQCLLEQLYPATVLR